MALWLLLQGGLGDQETEEGTLRQTLHRSGGSNVSGSELFPVLSLLVHPPRMFKEV